MKRNNLYIIGFLLMGFVFSGTQVFGQMASDLFFSEYTEPSSGKHMYLEVFNGTGVTADLSNYAILINDNGNAWNGLHIFPAGANLLDRNVWIIANDQADSAAILSKTNEKFPWNGGDSIVNFNGDDVRALSKIVTMGTTETDTFIKAPDTFYLEVIDLIGRYDMVDPGSGWDVAGTTNGTANHTLVRKSSVTSPNSDWDAAAGTNQFNSEWVVYPAQTWIYLGSHFMGSYPIVINEFMTNNVTTYTDPTDTSFDDWIELFNPNPSISLNGWYLTDIKGNLKWVFPDTSIDQNDYLVIWADNDSNDPGLHAGFTLDTSIALYLYNSEFAQVDSVKFSTQMDDTSYARIPNGTGSFQFAKPTPNAENEDWPQLIPEYTISQVTGLNSTGFPDSINVVCKLTGVVHSINFNKPGYEFYINDGNDGIAVKKDNNPYAYNVHEGDKIKVIGKINFWRGLTEFVPDSIVLLDSNQTLNTPLIVNAPSEATEAELIRINNLTIIDTSQWPKPTDDAQNVDVTNGTDTFIIKIVTACDLHGTTVPIGPFDITGLGSQYDPISPYTEGYQVIPRYKADLYQIPRYTIGQVTGVDSNGVAGSLGVFCKIKGIVHSVNFKAYKPGYEFYINDGDGIAVSNPFAYNVREGDEIEVTGTIAQYSGLTEIEPTSIELLDSNKTLNIPLVVNAPSEATEAELIRINNLSIIDTSQWPKITDSATNVDVTNGTDTFIIRIVTDCDLPGTTVPDTSFDIIGLGGQFDPSSPHTEGYQLFPRYKSDLLLYTSPPPIPLYNISDVTGIDIEGVADSLGVVCKLIGVVHSINFRAYQPGYEFNINDGDDGIAVYKFDNPLVYNVREGDEIMVTGTISQDRGLTEIEPNAIELLDSNKTLNTPSVAIKPDETTESELIRINNLTIIDTSTWPKPSDLAVNVEVTNGADVFVVRIVTDCDLHGTAVPDTSFDLIGIGSQDDTSFPYTSGYQIFPRYQADLIMHEPNGIQDGQEYVTLTLFPNPNNGRFLIRNNTDTKFRISIYNSLGELMLSEINYDKVMGIDMGIVEKGIYFIKIIDNDNKYIYSEKFLVR